MTKEQVMLFESLHLGTKGASFAHIEYEIPYSKYLLKGDRETKVPNPYSNVVRLATGVVGLGYEYEKSVNNQRKREGQDSQFSSLKPNGKSYVEGSRIVLEKDVDPSVNYLRVQDNAKPGLTSTFFEKKDGQLIEIPYEDIKGYLPPKKQSSRQGTDKAIIPFDITLEYIKVLKKGDVELQDI